MDANHFQRPGQGRAGFGIHHQSKRTNSGRDIKEAARPGARVTSFQFPVSSSAAGRPARESGAVIPVGTPVGIPEGFPQGIPVGIPFGISLGTPFGTEEGNAFGFSLGTEKGSSLGSSFGSSLGISFGTQFGTSFGTAFGFPFGIRLGIPFGPKEPSPRPWGYPERWRFRGKVVGISASEGNHWLGTDTFRPVLGLKRR